MTVNLLIAYPILQIMLQPVFTFSNDFFGQNKTKYFHFTVFGCFMTDIVVAL